MDLREAEGYVELGMWQEAWDSLDEVPIEERATPAVFRLRIRCCAPLDAWSVGEEIAYLMGQSPQPSDHRLAASFWLDWARADPAVAADCIAAAINIWPESRVEILEDPLLGRVLFPGRH
ncbi:MAG: hypothetical protein JWO82_1226 [Akkermansiaceae bacterium]|nr:hypothetical protein [Akkermansiaceae bacterium]